MILPSQVLGPGDLISLSVSDCPEMTRNFRISADGSLTLPLLPRTIPAAGKHAEEIEADIADTLLHDQILVHPVVSVAVVEYRSLPVTVLGAVGRPLTFEAVGDITLLEALTRADGVSAEAGSEALITRGADALRPANRVQHVSLKDLMSGANPALNIRLYGGEQILVPLAERVSSEGSVRKAGCFPMTGTLMTVTKVLRLSEGLLPNAAHQSFIYRILPGESGRQEIPIDLRGITQRRTPDVPLIANDILYVPDRHSKRIDPAVVAGMCK